MACTIAKGKGVNACRKHFLVVLKVASNGGQENRVHPKDQPVCFTWPQRGSNAMELLACVVKPMS